MPASPAATPPTTTPTGSDDTSGPAAPAPSTSHPKAVTRSMASDCGCTLSTLPDSKGLRCLEPAGHHGPHQAHGVTWPQLFPSQRPYRGGDGHDLSPDHRSQQRGSGADVTGPAGAT